MDLNSTLMDEQSDVLAGICEQLGRRTPDANAALKLEVCLELIAHVAMSRVSVNMSARS